MEVDRQDIPHGWYDLVVVGHGWEAIGAAWYARQLGARVAIVPGAQTAAATLKVPLPLCQWWNRCQAGWPNGPLGPGVGACWQPPTAPFVEGLPMGGQSPQPLPTDKALGQLAASGLSVFRGPACFQAPDVLEVQGHPIPFRKVLLALGQQKETISIPGAEPAQISRPEQLVEQLGFVGPFSGQKATEPVEPTPSGFPSLNTPGSPPEPAQQQKISPVRGESKRFGPRVALFGAGPEECFWAQWLARQGCQVHLLTAEAKILPDHPPEIRQWVQACLLQDGVRIHPHSLCQQVQPAGQAKVVLVDRLGQQEKLVVDFLAAVPDREPEFAGLQLEWAGVLLEPDSVRIDSSCRTTNRRIFAAGSVCGDQFRCPRIAWSMLQWAVDKALGRRPPQRDWLLRFQCIPTDPPIFWLGQTPAEAEQQFWPVQTYRVEADSPEALRTAGPIRVESPPSSPSPSPAGAKKLVGFLQVHIRRRTGRIIGAVVAGPWAHELADLVAFLIQQRISLPSWTVPTGCVSPGMQLLAEAAQLARQDHKPRWWDLPLEHLHRLWQLWRSPHPPQPKVIEIGIGNAMVGLP